MPGAWRTNEECEKKKTNPEKVKKRPAAAAAAATKATVPKADVAAAKRRRSEANVAKAESEANVVKAESEVEADAPTDAAAEPEEHQCQTTFVVEQMAGWITQEDEEIQPHLDKLAEERPDMHHRIVTLRSMSDRAKAYTAVKVAIALGKMPDYSEWRDLDTKDCLQIDLL